MSGKIVENRAGYKVFKSKSSYTCFFYRNFVLCIGFVIIKLKIEGQKIYRKPTKLQNSNQNSTLSWVSLIGLQELCFFGGLSLYINIMSYIKKVQDKPRLRDSTVVVIVRKRPGAIPLAMTTTRKSIRGFPLVSYMGMVLRLEALRAAEAPL